MRCYRNQIDGHHVVFMQAYVLRSFVTVTGFPVTLSIPLMSVVCIAYTALVSASHHMHENHFESKTDLLRIHL